MKTVCHKRFEFKSLFGKKITGGFDGGKISSDGGGLLLREVDLQRWPRLFGQVTAQVKVETVYYHAAFFKAVPV